MEVTNNLLKYILSLKFLQGYRTIFAGVGAIGLGVYLITQGEATQGGAAILTGLGALGLGGKLEDNTQAVNSNTIVTAAADPRVETVTKDDSKAIIAEIKAEKK